MKPVHRISGSARSVPRPMLLTAGWARAAETLFERGSYLVNTIAACGRCHTPRDAQGKPIGAMALAGGFAFDDGGIGHVVRPNITPDRETGIGQLDRGPDSSRRCANGTRPDGTSNRAADAVRYVSRNVGSGFGSKSPPICTGASRFAMRSREPNSRTHRLPRSRRSPRRGTTRRDKLAYGAYLAGPVGHCFGCHTVLRQDGRSLDRAKFYAGGRELADFGDVTKRTVSRNITSDPDDGLGKWSDADIKRAIVAGIRRMGPASRARCPTSGMPKSLPPTSTR